MNSYLMRRMEIIRKHKNANKNSIKKRIIKRRKHFMIFKKGIGINKMILELNKKNNWMNLITSGTKSCKTSKQIAKRCKVILKTNKTKNMKKQEKI